MARAEPPAGRSIHAATLLAWLWAGCLPELTLGTARSCTTDQWLSDGCQYQNDGECDVDLGYCPANTDCADCDPCGVVYAGYVGCEGCLAAGSNCRWCASSATCTSRRGSGAICDGGWATSTCNPADNLVGGEYFTDPAAIYQRWHLDAINVAEAWAMGYTGSGVNIIFQDDALDTTHPDFAAKFNTQGSPTENRLPPDSSSSHGTRVAGLAVAAANNSVCGVGVAYGATLSFSTFSSSEARTIGVENNINHISSNSWNLDACVTSNSPPSGTQSYSVVGSTCPFNASAEGTPCSPGCESTPADWTDSYGDSCAVYGAQQYCTPDGQVGPGWNLPAWGPIENYAVNGVSGLDACCECGAGDPTRGGCAGMDWGGSSISGDCVAFIAAYCSKYYGAGNGIYDPGCQDHWDLFVDCTHQALSNRDHNELLNGVMNGRNGRGIVYVFAAGNEYGIGENVNAEGWLNSIHTISVGATRTDGGHAYYSSAGAPVLVSAPGAGILGSLLTTQLTLFGGSGCGYIAGGGTSFSTPIVSAVVALMLEANPELSWRDVQDILARTSTQVSPNHQSWITNGAGLRHSDIFGFGQVNAGAAVRMAKDWQAADSKPHAVLAKFVPIGLTIPADDVGISCGVEVTASESQHIASLEHVVLYITTSGHEARGELRITLTSPSGVESLLQWTSADDGQGGTDFSEVKFMTVKNWGESPVGFWTIHVVDRRDNEASGDLASWRLALYGKCSADAVACSIIMQPRASAGSVCENTCFYAFDGDCDDGGQDADYAVCEYGSDCNDCGSRDVVVYYDHDGTGGPTALVAGQAHCMDPHASTTTKTTTSSSGTATTATSTTSSSVAILTAQTTAAADGSTTDSEPVASGPSDSSHSTTADTADGLTGSSTTSHTGSTGASQEFSTSMIVAVVSQSARVECMPAFATALLPTALHFLLQFLG
mmetsp:Transcript_323/g.903  ORF Transcript_323/g.903 Transcript_323/m.903 type:complete len:941 (-) Transcript_323:190-3012(-)